MNAGDIGSPMVVERMASMSCMVASSIRQPSISPCVANVAPTMVPTANTMTASPVQNDEGSLVASFETDMHGFPIHRYPPMVEPMASVALPQRKKMPSRQALEGNHGHGGPVSAP